MPVSDSSAHGTPRRVRDHAYPSTAATTHQAWTPSPSSPPPVVPPRYPRTPPPPPPIPSKTMERRPPPPPPPRPHSSSRPAYNQPDVVDRTSSLANKSPLVVLVLGATGSGKSTFINTVSGSNLPVGAGLKSTSSRIQATYQFALFSRAVTLIDTPGFDDTVLSNTEVLNMIASYLVAMYKNGQYIHGIIYMHRISDVRVGGSARRSFNMFRRICGDACMGNAIIVTNMWSEVTAARGEAREQQLSSEDDLFKPAIDSGAQIFRHDGTDQSSQALLAYMLDFSPCILRIQRELVDERKALMQTQAGMELNRDLVAIMRKQQDDLKSLEREMQEALTLKDEASRQELAEERQRLFRELDNAKRERDRLLFGYSPTTRQPGTGGSAASSEPVRAPSLRDRRHTISGGRKEPSVASSAAYPRNHSYTTERVSSSSSSATLTARPRSFQEAGRIAEAEWAARQAAQAAAGGAGSADHVRHMHSQESQLNARAKLQQIEVELAEERRRRAEIEAQISAYKVALDQNAQDSELARRDWQRQVDVGVTQPGVGPSMAAGYAAATATYYSVPFPYPSNVGYTGAVYPASYPTTGYPTTGYSYYNYHR